MITLDDIWQKLSNKKYREQYALSLLKRSVAFQIKTLRKKHCGSQAVLAERSKLTQGVVSRAEDQEYGNLTFNTVGRIAAGLDMAFIGRFVPWSELAKFSQSLSEDEFLNIPTFEEEDASLAALVQRLAYDSAAQGGALLICGALQEANEDAANPTRRIGPNSVLGCPTQARGAAAAGWGD